MVVFRVIEFPQGQPKRAEPVGDAFEAPSAVDAGVYAAQRVGRPDPSRSYWLEYRDAADRWQSAGAVAF